MTLANNVCSAVIEDISKLLLKSVHFKKKVAQSSFLSKFVIFGDFALISAKMTTLLKEMRIAQLSS